MILEIVEIAASMILLLLRHPRNPAFKAGGNVREQRGKWWSSKHCADLFSTLERIHWRV